MFKITNIATDSKNCKMKHLNFFLIILITSLFVSCERKPDESNFINPSMSVIEMEGEGGEVEVLFTHPYWKVARIINRNGNVSISGDMYSLTGSLIRENSILKLDTLGRIDAFWSNKGFSIIRNNYKTLKVVLRENSTGEDFNFNILLEAENESKEIQVNQKKSQGYTFKKIEYKLEGNDGDSVFVKQGTSYSFNIESAQDFTFYPIKGIDIVKTSIFESEENDAFVWTESNSIPVQIPSGIWSNSLYFNGEESLYTSSPIKKESEFASQTETVTIPSGKSGFTVDIQFRKLRVTYSLHLENKRTKKEKIIHGKWIEFAPTGNFSVNWR